MVVTFGTSFLLYFLIRDASTRFGLPSGALVSIDTTSTRLWSMKYQWRFLMLPPMFYHCPSFRPLESRPRKHEVAFCREWPFCAYCFLPASKPHSTFTVHPSPFTTRQPSSEPVRFKEPSRMSGWISGFGHAKLLSQLHLVHNCSLKLA